MLYSEKPCSVRWAWGSSVFLKAYKPTSLHPLVLLSPVELHADRGVDVGGSPPLSPLTTRAYHPCVLCVEVADMFEMAVAANRVVLRDISVAGIVVRCFIEATLQHIRVMGHTCSQALTLSLVYFAL